MSNAASAPLAIAAQPTAPIALIDELPNNPRAHWGDMDGLTASIKAKGVLEPLVVRPQPKGRLQLLCGARRFRASKAAGLTDVPVTVREGVTDNEALELALIENLQRHDVHRLNEALTMDALMKADPLYTVDALSARLGKSGAHIKDTLKLLTLSKPVLDAYAADEILDGHALAIAGLPESRHKDALAECYLPMWQSDGDKKALRPLAALKRWIADTQPIDLAAPETAEMFPEAAKVAAAGGDRGALLIHRGYDDRKQKGGPTILGSKNWREAAKKDACGREAVFGIGRERGSVIRVCMAADCAKHFPKHYPQASGRSSSAPKKSKAVKAAEVKRAQLEKQKRERQALVRAKAVEAAVAKVTSVTKDVARVLFGDVVTRFDLDGTEMETAFAKVTGLKVQGYRLVGDIASLNEAQLAKGLLFHQLGGIYNDGERAKALRAFKVDIAAIERQVIADEKTAAAAAKAKGKADAKAKGKADAKARAKAAKTTPAKPAAKATAKASTKKTAAKKR